MNEEEKAKRILENEGFYVGNLWHIDDVKNFNSNLTNEDCQRVLDSVLRSFIGQINEAIEDFLAEEGMK